MSRHPVRERFFDALRAFRGARSGNVAATFAIATIPLVGLIGSAIDYSRANSTKAAMQSALDATALMLSKSASSMTPAQISSKAQSSFLALFTRPGAKDIVITASYTTSAGSQVLLNANAAVDTTFMSMMGYNTLPISVSSTAKWGTSRLRVALVLDNTGSMSDDGKMAALKTATSNLLAMLKDSVTNAEDVYVSIIPFAKDVNVGKSNLNANWIDWTDWEANSSNWSCSNSKYTTKSTCQSNNGTWSLNNRNTWNGCVTDRGGSSAPDSNNYDQNVTAPGSTSASRFPAEQYNACPAAMLGLTNNWKALGDLVTAMTPNGGTNQPIGLVWGWQSLVGGGGLTAPAKDPKYTYSDVIILMSDGLNTQNRWYGSGSSVSTSVDKRMYDSTKNGIGTCANVKAAGVMIYAVQVNTGRDPTSTLMQNCASTTDKFTMITSANQLVTTFASIGTSLTKLRIAN